ncbi:hypothetical protein QBC33DRAFT_608559 [Phialemonium atrogriseum]|uniref:non-specific serine/threonine protein kinase n=1 Tax=Phialemonium atrogriseum TaxID=1093897 RepID=A0AAJ0FT28_9PEZI|nr:uncharacterized protein QBC33DRAFT_608559 [Phialemonium atrogriseum]KAK1771720.1 hypothetical protein QBC33DRAFT_608559 [Phialemonium atrogriseum]
MEANRIWHETVVEAYSNLITPGVCCSAAVYDLANRRWYQLNVRDPVVPDADWRHDTRLDEVPDDEWLGSTVEKHIKAHYHSTAALPPWNTISTNSSGFPVTFELSEEALVRRPISENFCYGIRPSDKLPTTRKCVFKRIDFDCDVESHENEIRTREAIIRCIERDRGSASKDQNYVMERRFNVVPILAVVLHDETSNWIVSNHSVNKDYLHDIDTELHSHQIAGFLMPYAGCSPDLLGMSVADSDRFGSTASTSPAMGSSSTVTNLPISEEQLLDLACGIQKLSRCGVVHGDICHWNVVLTQPESTALHAARLLLIDMGDIAPDYEGDADALGNLFLWCLEHSAKLRDTTAIRKRIVIATVLLKGGDLDRAIGVLSSSKTRGSFKRPLSSANQEVKRRRL